VPVLSGPNNQVRLPVTKAGTLSHPTSYFQSCTSNVIGYVFLAINGLLLDVTQLLHHTGLG
jgi:hypothetical protein